MSMFEVGLAAPAQPSSTKPLNKTRSAAICPTSRSRQRRLGYTWKKLRLDAALAQQASEELKEHRLAALISERELNESTMASISEQVVVLNETHSELHARNSEIEVVVMARMSGKVGPTC